MLIIVIINSYLFLIIFIYFDSLLDLSTFIKQCPLLVKCSHDQYSGVKRIYHIDCLWSSSHWHRWCRHVQTADSDSMLRKGCGGGM